MIAEEQVHRTADCNLACEQCVQKADPAPWCQDGDDVTGDECHDMESDAGCFHINCFDDCHTMRTGWGRVPQDDNDHANPLQEADGVHQEPQQRDQRIRLVPPCCEDEEWLESSCVTYELLRSYQQTHENAEAATHA